MYNVMKCPTKSMGKPPLIFQRFGVALNFCVALSSLVRLGTSVFTSSRRRILAGLYYPYFSPAVMVK